MILGIYKKNSPKEKWTLAVLALDMKTATEHSKRISNHAKKIGFDNAVSTIQSFSSIHDVPKTLDKIQSETLLYN